jgi:Flp pilus assembly protein TadG
VAWLVEPRIPLLNSYGEDPLKRLLFPKTWKGAADQNGATAAEFALVVPVFLTMVFGSIEVGRFMWIRSSLQTAVETAARCSALNSPSCSTIAATQTYAAQVAMGASVPSSAFTVATEACGRVVTASYNFTPITPLVPLDATITARSCRSVSPGP